MLLSRRPIAHLCRSCRLGLLSLFSNGLCSATQPIRSRQKRLDHYTPTYAEHPRFFHITKQRRDADEREELSEEFEDEVNPMSPAEMEAVVRRARRTFGETLPRDFLSSEEYMIYERLYGPPLQDTRPEDISLLQDPVDDIEEDKISRGNTLLRENDKGDLEEVGYKDVDQESVKKKELEDHDERRGPPLNDSPKRRPDSSRANEVLQEDIVRASISQEPTFQDDFVNVEDQSLEPAQTQTEEVPHRQDFQDEGELDEFDDSDDAYGHSDSLRTHPLTSLGRFATSPTTLQLPKDIFINPIDSLLSGASNRHLSETAHKIFGGVDLPNSTATPSSKKQHLRQQPIALEASQPKMGEMEANAYLAAIMPGAYASTMSTLVETRKRLGSEWLRKLLSAKEEPRILDAGAGGAGVLAWREILRAEWESLHQNGITENQAPPIGKATVVVGSSELRRRTSKLLENTTFLPRLPDFSSATDLKVPRDTDLTSRMQYDVIIAPNTLWKHEEEHRRRAQVHNYWSLLNPNGGVLILIEKGVPRGFELIAGARDLLLKHHISSTGLDQAEDTSQSIFDIRQYEKEIGMIVAPCTNHTRCPMYLVSGQSKGRKEHCHFSQRFIRPAFLQNVLGARDHNHEDILFSYLVVQRGQDKRHEGNIEQSMSATDNAFAGYEADVPMRSRNDVLSAVEEKSHISPLSLPRSLLPPLKRHGHVILDVCTPAGSLERWTVSKSHSKQAYRDARKSKWGDLWALGAKTRILRTARAGTVEDGKKRVRAKVVTDDPFGENESDGFSGKAAGLGSMLGIKLGRKPRKGKLGKVEKSRREVRNAF
ncbi:37S ribosomal protein S22 [Loxospora ochrophaea]|nr:37S ribosomal protein S22 [Loxospora ochrophaea]